MEGAMGALRYVAPMARVQCHPPAAQAHL